MSSRILIIDDDDKLNRLLTNYLGGMGYEVLASTRPSDGLNRLTREQPDLIILDIMLPEMDGLQVCRTIRREHSTPIIMLTARGETMDRIVGLELGADDYIPKPFEPRELVARIQSVLRRAIANTTKNYIRTFSGLTIDYQRRTAALADEPVRLTTLEFECLALLTRNAGKVLNRDQILDALHGIEWDAYTRTVDITMSRLRQKLGDDPKSPTYIKTIWGTGYMFIGQEDHAA